MMSDKDKLARRMGGALDAELGDGPGITHSAEYRQAFIDSRPTGTQSRRLWPRIALAAAAVAALTSTGLFFATKDRSEIEIRIGKNGERAVAGSWARSTAGKRVPIFFAGGSRFELIDSSALRIEETGPERVRVDLHHGLIDASIKRDRGMEWIVSAGPYAVKVIGTEFTVRWNADAGELEVDVDRGHVLVEGANLGERGVAVDAGYYLRADSETGEVAIHAQAAPHAEVAALEALTAAATERVETRTKPLSSADGSANKLESGSNGEPSPDTPVAPKLPTLKTPEWRRLYDLGDYRGAIAATGERDLEWLAHQADLEMLWQLANAARYTKRPGAAKKLFIAVRERFSGTGRAATAAFLIAKIALEINREPGIALRWFDTYLGEAPRGTLAEEALGHSIEICSSSGRRGEAERRAQTYLARHPDGVFAENAREVLAQ